MEITAMVKTGLMLGRLELNEGGATRAQRSERKRKERQTSEPITEWQCVLQFGCPEEPGAYIYAYPASDIPPVSCIHLEIDYTHRSPLPSVKDLTSKQFVCILKVVAFRLSCFEGKARKDCSLTAAPFRLGGCLRVRARVLVYVE